MIVYAETGMGACLREYRDLATAEREILKEVGTHNGVTLVRNATKKDVQWVRGMGGRVTFGADKIK